MPACPLRAGLTGEQGTAKMLLPEEWQGAARTPCGHGFFGNLKTGMRGAYKHVSLKWLQSYLDEYAWRHNAKREGKALFTQLLARAAS